MQSGSTSGPPEPASVEEMLLERGNVTVGRWEGESQLGGQARLAELLPRRAEFGGIVTHLTRELEIQQVQTKRI